MLDQRSHGPGRLAALQLDRSTDLATLRDVFTGDGARGVRRSTRRTDIEPTRHGKTTFGTYLPASSRAMTTWCAPAPGTTDARRGLHRADSPPGPCVAHGARGADKAAIRGSFGSPLHRRKGLQGSSGRRHMCHFSGTPTNQPAGTSVALLLPRLLRLYRPGGRKDCSGGQVKLPVRAEAPGRWRRARRRGDLAPRTTAYRSWAPRPRECDKGACHSTATHLCETSRTPAGAAGATGGGLTTAQAGSRLRYGPGQSKPLPSWCGRTCWHGQSRAARRLLSSRREPVPDPIAAVWWVVGRPPNSAIHVTGKLPRQNGRVEIADAQPADFRNRAMRMASCALRWSPVGYP